MENGPVPARFYALRSWLVRLLALSAAAYLLYYIWWRAVYTINPAQPVFAWAVWFAESFGVVNFLLFTWMTQDIRPTKTWSPPRAGLSVDVFVPTYNEDLQILEATLTGCQGIRYPHTTYVLDDGHRPQVAELARKLGCQYLSRADNQHAKAGNLNYALSHSSGEFIAILDADMVPQPDYLDRTLGYFEDARLAFVQMPQEFYNRDSIQHDRRDKNWHEQSLFFRVIQPGKNHSNSAFWTGSPSVLRRAALLDIGGVATDTITEDIHTSVRLHARKWRSLFVNEALAYGIAPQTVHAFLMQRLRWAQGTMQLYRSKDNPLWKPGLTLRQRLSYFASFRAYMEAIQKTILIFTPPIIILFRVLPMQIDGAVFFLHWLPYFVITLLANQITGRGYFNYMQSEKFNLLKTLIFLRSFFALLPIRLSFKVTPKSIADDVYSIERSEMRFFMALLGALIGITVSGLLSIQDALRAGLPTDWLGIAVIWGAFNAGIILLAVRDVLVHRHERKHYRFPFKIPATLLQHGAAIAEIDLDDISAAGLSFRAQAGLAIQAAGFAVRFETPLGEQLTLPLRSIELGEPATVYAAQLGELSAADRRSFIEMLYVSFPARLPNRGYIPQPL
jgi:cellulose synthase (UDP-forming)